MVVKYSRLKIFLFLTICFLFLGLLIDVFLIPFKYVDAFILFMFILLSSPLIYYISSLLYLLIIAAKNPALVTDNYGIHIQSPFGQTRHIRWCEIKKISYSLHHVPRSPFLTYQRVNIETKNINRSFQIPDFLYKNSSLKKLKQELEKEFKKYKNSK